MSLPDPLLYVYSDSVAWLHKAIFATAEESMDLGFEEHLLYVDFLITRTRNFRLCGVEPVMVFDGKRSCLKVSLPVASVLPSQHMLTFSLPLCVFVFG